MKVPPMPKRPQRPQPGSLMCKRYLHTSGPNGVVLIVSISETAFPGEWTQYQMLALTEDSRLVDLEVEKNTFNVEWHVIS